MINEATRKTSSSKEEKFKSTLERHQRNERKNTQSWRIERNNGNPRPIIARFVSYKKRNELLTNKRELKNTERRQHVFVCEDLTPL